MSPVNGLKAAAGVSGETAASLSHSRLGAPLLARIHPLLRAASTAMQRRHNHSGLIWILSGSSFINSVQEWKCAPPGEEKEAIPA